MKLFTRFREIGSAYAEAKRLRDISAVLLKYGYDDLSRHLPLPRASRLPFRRLREQQTELQQLSQPERLRQACEELGPTFIKLGQFAAARTHFLPAEFTDELAKLQDQVAPLPFATIQNVIETELKQPLAALFADIDPTPLGSASIAQVHRATLRSGEDVVVKVQRPGIPKTVEEDLVILRHLAQLAETHLPHWRLHRPVALVEELGRNLHQELDFTAEAAHLQRFAWQFRDQPGLLVPAVSHALTTRHVLVMQYVAGSKATQLDELTAAGLDRREIARRIAELVMQQMFSHGFFHADPHPGNILILPDQRVCFLDFGQMGFLDQQTREAFIDLVWGIARRHEGHAAAALLRLADHELEPPQGPFEAEVAEFMHRHFYRTAGEFQFPALVRDLLQLAGRHRLRLPPDLVMMLKALSVTEELVRRMDPALDLVALAKPFMQRARLERLRPRRVLADALDMAGEFGTAAREIPREMRRIVAQVRAGRARVNFHHEGLEPASQALERSANRLAFAVVVAALIIGSSLTIHSKVPPLWGDVSVLGAVGYLLAGLLGLWLLLGILRHGRM